jgi:hypothetical protein
MAELQKCSKCKCKKLLELFKVRKNTGKIYKTCLQCCDRFSCDQCESKFASNGDLLRHIKLVHDQIKDYECNQCDYKCSENGNLQKHIKSVHDKIKDYECELCEYKCSENGTLQKHIKSVHDKIKDYECELCEYKCSENGTLLQHIKSVHNQIKDYECELCDYKCSRNGTLQIHIQTCKGEDKSNMSGLEFKAKEALEILGFNQQEDYIFNQSYSKLTDYCGKRLRPDFRFIKHKIIIEVDGGQHYKPMMFGNSQEEAEDNFKIIQDNDKIKNDFCRIYGYKMIRIKYTEIMNLLEILHSDLDEIIEY